MFATSPIRGLSAHHFLDAHAAERNATCRRCAFSRNRVVVVRAGSRQPTPAPWQHALSGTAALLAAMAAAWNPGSAHALSSRAEAEAMVAALCEGSDGAGGRFVLPQAGGGGQAASVLKQQLDDMDESARAELARACQQLEEAAGRAGKSREDAGKAQQAEAQGAESRKAEQQKQQQEQAAKQAAAKAAQKSQADAAAKQAAAKAAQKSQKDDKPAAQQQSQKDDKPALQKLFGFSGPAEPPKDTSKTSKAAEKSGITSIRTPQNVAGVLVAGSLAVGLFLKNKNHEKDSIEEAKSMDAKAEAAKVKQLKAKLELTQQAVGEERSAADQLRAEVEASSDEKNRKLQQETEALGRQAAQLRGSNKGLQAKLEAQREELTGRVRSATSITMQAREALQKERERLAEAAAAVELARSENMQLRRETEALGRKAAQLQGSNKGLQAKLEAQREELTGRVRSTVSITMQAREALQKEKERREAAAASVEQVRSEYMQLRKETEALGRKAAQLRGSNQGLQTKLEAQREELTGRVRSATSITMQAREALQKEREQRAAQAASVEQVRSEYMQLQRETEALGRKAAQLQGSNKGLQTKLDAQREELTGRVRSATSITMQAREALQKEREQRAAQAALVEQVRSEYMQLQRETEALGRKAAQLQGSNKGLQTKLDAQREELTGRVRSTVSITMQAREALQEEKEQRAAQAAMTEQVRTEYMQLQRETEALGRQAAQLRGSNKGLQAKLDAQREELTGRMRSAVSITMQAREALQKEKEQREAAAASVEQVRSEYMQLQRETEALGRQAAQLRGSNKGLQTKLDTQREELTGRVRSATSITMQAREALQKEKERREAAEASVEQVRTEYMQLQRETEALGRKAAQLQGSNKGLQAKLDAQREELTGRVRSTVSITMQAREALQEEKEQRAAQAALVEQVRSEYMQLQRETEALGRKAAQLQGSNKGLQAKLEAQREELSGRVRSATSITMQAREDLQKEKERREAADASNAKLQDMVERVMQDAQSAYIKAAAELKLERASRGQVEGMAADLRGQLEGIYAAKEAARSAAQHTLAILEKEESALNALKEAEASGPGTNGAAANLVAERTEA